jgi:riboflavin kinase/FMN adenylyltransferase
LKVFKDLESLIAESSNHPSYAVTIGNFDGCHVGHQKLIAQTRQLADAHPDGESLGLTFSPHPRYFFQPDLPPEDLFTADQKIQAFRELGMDNLLIQTFDKNFAATTAEDFYGRYLKQQIGARSLVVGANFFFGRGRQGGPEFLRQRATEDGVTMKIAEPEIFADKPISSSRVRRTLQDSGQVEDVWSMLGRPYALQGRVYPGQKLGRTIGFPTMNLGDLQQVIPRSGVYAGFAWIETQATSTPAPVIHLYPAKLLPAVFNIGYRPTVQNDMKLAVEGHLLAAPESIPAEQYEQKVSFYFTHRLRDEQKFADLAALQQQIQADCNRARKMLEPLLNRPDQAL